MEYFTILPVEIMSDILARLPVESIIKCKLVCTNWRSLVRHPSFSKMHLHHLNHLTAIDSGELSFLVMGHRNHRFRFRQLYYFECNENTRSSRIRRINLTLPFPCNNIVGSFNGLVCLYGCQDNKLYGPACICNPVTKEFVILPKGASPANLKWSYLLSGFGYLPSTNEYKVVRMYMLQGEANFIEVEVYTLGSGSGWRNLGKFEYALNILHSVHGDFANGALYWVDMEKRIVAFDLAEEKFCGHLLPPVNSGLFRLGVWDGLLLYVEGDRSQSDIWILKAKNNNEEHEKHQSLGWSKEFTLVGSEPVAFTKSGCALCCSDGYFCIYDPKSLTSTRLLSFGNDVCQVLPHVNSFLTLKELGEEDTKIMESGEIEEVQSSDLPTKQL